MKRALELMLAELESNRLEVQLVPCRRFVNEGGCYRVAVSKNAKWYSDFCSRHASERQRAKAAFDTRIKRRNTVSALTQLIGGFSRSKYAPELLRIAARFNSKGVAA